MIGFTNDNDFTWSPKAFCYPIDANINIGARGRAMQLSVVEKTFKLAGDGDFVAQFTFITSGTVHVWFPNIGLQMEAHCNQLRIQDNTLIYTDGLQYGQRRALWALTLHDEDITEFICTLSQFNQPPHRTKTPARKHRAVA